MADIPSSVLLLLFLTLGLVSATPIKFFSDDDNALPHTDMFKALRNVISKLGEVHENRRLPENETKPRDLDIESSSAFAFGPEQMRRLIAKKMAGAELAGTAETAREEKTKVIGKVKEEKKLHDEDEEEKEKEMKSVEQIGCSDKEDCNTTSYCNKLSYTCVGCHGDGVTCVTDDECCDGYTCHDDTNKCHKKKDFITGLDEFEGFHAKFKKGKEGERCTSKGDCGEEFCCALNNNGDGECQAYLKEGGECGSDPFTTFFTSQSLFARDSTSDLPNKCPCHHDLHCEKKGSFLFVDSPVCTKKADKKDVKKTDHKSIIKITLRSSPIVRFHSDSISDSNPLTSLLPKELMKMLHKPPMRRGFTMRISSRRDKKPRKSSASRKLSFPFFPFPFSNPFVEQDMDELKEMKTKREVKRESVADDDELRHERRKVVDDDDDVKRERRKLVDDVAEEARASVHRAVDGIFDTIMKKITATKRYLE